MADSYSSQYTGSQVDQAVGDKIEAGSYEYIQALPVTTSTTKLFICTSAGEYLNTLWRSNGVAIVQVGGSGGGGGGGGSGTDVRPITSVDSSELQNASRLAGLVVAGTAYRVTHAIITGAATEGAEGTLVIR